MEWTVELKWSFGRICIKKRITDHDFPPPFMWAENKKVKLYELRFTNIRTILHFTKEETEVQKMRSQLYQHAITELLTLYLK